MRVGEAEASTRSTRPRVRWRRAILAGITMFLAMFAVLAGAEVVLRVTDRTPARFVYDPVVGYINRPDAEFVHGALLVRTGSNGRIASPVPGNSERPDLLVIGDSYAAGQCASWPEGWVEVATRALARTRPGYTTVNLGTSGYGTDQCLLRLREFMEPVPRTVVYLMCDNDLHDNFDHFHFGLFKPRFELRAGDLVQVESASMANRLVLGLKVGGLVAGRFVRPATHKSAWRDHTPEDRAALALALIGEMKRLSEERGARFMVAAHWLATLPAPEEDFALLVALLRAAGIETVVLNERVDLSSHYDAACWHWDTEGHRLVGEELATALAGLETERGS